MRPPAQIREHLPVEQLFAWLQQAPDQEAYKRRLAIWLTHTGRLHARQVAQIVGCSVPAVWLWIGQYNRLGPAGLARTGRGGRRWGLLTAEQEECLVDELARQTPRGQTPTARELQVCIEKRISREVSLPYVYKLLARHNWPSVLARVRASAVGGRIPDSFVKHSRPWLRRP